LYTFTFNLLTYLLSYHPYSRNFVNQTRSFFLLLLTKLYRHPQWLICAGLRRAISLNPWWRIQRHIRKDSGKMI